MEQIDRVVIFLALSAAVIFIVTSGKKMPVVGTAHEKIPNERLNVSSNHHMGAMTGPLYLLSNLPAWRRSDDQLPYIADGSTYISFDGVQTYGD